MNKPITMRDAVLRWTTAEERRQIAKRHNIVSRSTISNVLRGIHENVPLLEDLIAKAEENKARKLELEQRAQTLGV